MTKEEQEKFELLVEAINKVKEFKNILVITKEYQLAATLREFEKVVQQSLSNFLSIKKTYTAEDLQKAFYAGRSGIANTPEYNDRLKSSASYPTFESWLQTITC